jgi:predicted hotdog family 3-hydroxylacyl-ACP dehydratase
VPLTKQQEATARLGMLTSAPEYETYLVKQMELGLDHESFNNELARSSPDHHRTLRNAWFATVLWVFHQALRQCFPDQQEATVEKIRRVAEATGARASWYDAALARALAQQIQMDLPTAWSSGYDPKLGGACIAWTVSIMEATRHQFTDYVPDFLFQLFFDEYIPQLIADIRETTQKEIEIHEAIQAEDNLRRVSDDQLNLMAQGPETAFAPALWRAVQSELARRAIAPQMLEAIRRCEVKSPSMHDISAWSAVARAMTRDEGSAKVYEIIGHVLASDAMFSASGQAGYPLDFQVGFGTQLDTGDIKLATELMWVRVLGVAEIPNHWVGRLLNEPRLFMMAAKDAYVEFRSDRSGLHFVRVVNSATANRSPPSA